MQRPACSPAPPETRSAALRRRAVLRRRPPALLVAAGTKHKTKRRTKTTIEPKVARPWNVIVWDDPVNLMNYVVYVFQKLFGFSLEIATTKMLEVHEKGRSVVATEERERAEFFVTRLHSYGLQATIEQVEG